MNVTTEVNKNNALSESSLAEILIDHSIDAIIAIDAAHCIIIWNRTAEMMYNKSRTKAIGKPLSEVIPSISADEETMKAIALAEKGLKSYVPASRHYAHRLHVENHYIPLQNSDGNFIGVMNLVHDVAHRIKAEEQLQSLNTELVRKNKALQQHNKELIALGNITSHDLKEPLRKIYTAVEAIITGEAQQLSNSGRAHLRRIQSAVQRMGLITDDLLSFLNITKERNEADYGDADLNAVLEEAKKRLQKMIEEKGVIIQSQPLPLLYGNYNLLVQLFQNIIHNAVKFQQPDAVPEVHISAAAIKKDNKNYVRVMFKDNGIGFKQEQAENIFIPSNRLWPNEFHGSGMGLAVNKRIMEQHNGFIEAESSEGKGTGICCYFPV